MIDEFINLSNHMLAQEVFKKLIKVLEGQQTRIKNLELALEKEKRARTRDQKDVWAYINALDKKLNLL